jgi:hypothetical protein
MKQFLGAAMLTAVLSAGCSLEVGAEGLEDTEEVAADESLGSLSESLTSGYWLQTFLAPLAPMQLPSGGRQVCRATYAPGSGYPGYLDGRYCHYAHNGFARHSLDYQVVERTGLSWRAMGYTCGRGQTCFYPIPSNMVGTAGYGICAVQIGGLWRSGFFTNNACYTAPTTGSVYTRTPINLTMKALVKN